MCWRLSDWRQNEQAEEEERDHLQRFFFVARVLFRYFVVKLKMFLGIFIFIYIFIFMYSGVGLISWRVKKVKYIGGLGYFPGNVGDQSLQID